MPRKNAAAAAAPVPVKKKAAAKKSSVQPALYDAPTLTADPVSADVIFIKGARMHNLKNVDVAIPRNKLVVVTGVSGSGKSSLTMDTLFAEGQRRYAESLSAYARQFLVRMDKPDVDYIRGICPAIAIEQKVSARTPRSTVGSMTELSDYLRLLFARVGRTFSPVTGKEVKKDTVSDIVDSISRMAEGTRVQIMVGLVTRYGRTVLQELDILMQKGFVRVFSETSGVIRIEDALADNSLVNPKEKLYILIDRIVVKAFDEDDLHRLADSVQTAFYESEGDCILHITSPVLEGSEHEATPAPEKAAGEKKKPGKKSTDKSSATLQHSNTPTLQHSITPTLQHSNPPTLQHSNTPTLQHFSSRFEADGITFEEPVPNLFSFNNPLGACPVCEGFGQVLGIDPDLVIPDKRLSVYDGAVVCWRGEKMSQWQGDFIRSAARFDFPVHKPIMDLSDKELALLWEGNGRVNGINDFFTMVGQNLYKVQYRIMQARYRGRTVCGACKGTRLRPEALYVKVSGANIAQLLEMPASDLGDWMAHIRLSEHEQAVAKRILIEINQRLKTLLDVGLGYLNLNRTANTLSGGESQRIQLTKFLGSNLTDSLYILDEPSIGLHPRDTARLIGVLKNLRDLGNTVVVVEHDEMMMQEADYIIDMGPLASHLGGEVVAAGDYPYILAHPESLTGKYLSGRLRIEVPAIKRKPGGYLRLEGARQHNLKDISVSFPLNTLTVVTGVSGSGKTTLVKGTLFPALQKHFGTGTERPGLHKEITGDLASISAVELVDQNPIGKSSRSNPVTYIKAWDEVRKLYEKQPVAKMRGFDAKYFSFNTDGGRCDTCKGDGEVVVEMQFLADVHLLCESCKGKRFKDEVLEVTYRQASISDVLNMSVDEAIAFFREEKKIAKCLQPLSDVGLGYVKLGQSSDTLSGGEAQRVKLASFLGRGSGGGKILFIFDEPTTGLHFHDIKKLLASFEALIDSGHSILVIEHNTEVIKSADWVIDLGPEGGAGGGQLLYEGTPEGLKSEKRSLTGQYL